MSRPPGRQSVSAAGGVSPPGPFTITPAGVRIRVRLTPKSSRDEVEASEALADGSMVLGVRVRAVPEDGAANRALVAVLAKVGGVGKTAVAVVSGATSRIKTVEIAGDGAAIAARLGAVALSKTER